MKWILSLSLLMLSSLAQAEVSQDQVGEMLKQMVKENVISEEEAKKAVLKMKTMNAAEWSTLNGKASTVAASRKPASTDAIKEAKGKDLDGAQFRQIQDDIKNIMPQYQE